MKYIMIAEIFSNAQDEKRLKRPLDSDGDILIDNLSYVFDKLRLPVPDHNYDLWESREGGYNLFLNRYAAVLRIYPSPKKDRTNYRYKVSSDDLNPVEYFRFAHAYTPDSVTPIGLVQFDDFVIQLMPGLINGENCDENLISKKSDEMMDYVDYTDWNITNIGKLGSNIMLFDTVSEMDLELYRQFYGRGILDETIKSSKYFEKQQKLFYDAWVGDISFENFWKNMEQIKEEKITADGWNNSYLSAFFEPSNHPRVFAASYDKKLKSYLSDENPRSVVVEPLDIAYVI